MGPLFSNLYLRKFFFIFILVFVNDKLSLESFFLLVDISSKSVVFVVQVKRKG